MLNGYDLFVIIFVLILLLIAFFVMGYLYARIHFMRFFSQFLKMNQANMENAIKTPRNVKIKKIEVDNKEEFEKMMKNIFEEMEDDEENGNRNDS